MKEIEVALEDEKRRCLVEIEKIRRAQQTLCGVAFGIVKTFHSLNDAGVFIGSISKFWEHQTYARQTLETCLHLTEMNSSERDQISKYIEYVSGTDPICEITPVRPAYASGSESENRGLVDRLRRYVGI